MITKYSLKIFVTGNIVEVYRYEAPQYRGLESNNLSPEKRNSFGEKTDSSIYRSRKSVRRLMNSNPDLKKFYTLTFAENMTDLDEANRLFKIFMQKMKRKFPKIKYLAVIEFQKRGAVHYHFLSNIRYVRQEIIAEMWGNGFIWVNPATNLKNVGGYLMKYMRKDMSDKRLYGRRTYLYSRNLERPIELLDDVAQKYLDMYENEVETLCSFTLKHPRKPVEFEMLFTGKS